jgi:LacI family transcriptional regulator, xylobiose transport system transcriptional regulator
MSAEMTSGEPATRATLAEVAVLADVSISTVSKVLNGRGGVSEETRARIEALLQDHQYNRRSPGPNHAPLIEVLCFEIASSWAAEAIAGIERLAREQGVGMVVSGTNDRQKPDLDWIEGVLNRRPLGVILVACNLLHAQQRQLRSRSIPFSMAGRHSPPSSNCSCRGR